MIVVEPIEFQYGIYYFFIRISVETKIYRSSRGIVSETTCEFLLDSNNYNEQNLFETATKAAAEDRI
jgi:hypothetical protein